MHTRKVCSLALRPGHVAKRCRVFPAEERKNLLLESKVWVPGSTVTPPSSESSDSCRIGRWSIRAARDFLGATKHHVTRLATAAEVAAIAKSSHKSTSMARGRAMFLGKNMQLEPQSVQHLTGQLVVSRTRVSGSTRRPICVQPQQCRVNGGAATSDVASTTSFQQEAIRLSKPRCAAQELTTAQRRKAVRSGLDLRGVRKHQVFALWARGSGLGPPVLGPTQTRRPRHNMRRQNSNDGQCTRQQVGRGRGGMQQEMPAHKSQSGVGPASLRHLVIALQGYEPISREYRGSRPTLASVAQQT